MPSLTYCKKNAPAVTSDSNHGVQCEKVRRLWHFVFHFPPSYFFRLPKSVSQFLEKRKSAKRRKLPHDVQRLLRRRRFVAVHCHVARLPDVLRAELQTAFRGDFLALGMLGWELAEATVQAKNLLFPWHRDNEGLCELFDRLCDEGAKSVEQEFDRWSID